MAMAAIRREEKRLISPPRSINGASGPGAEKRLFFICKKMVRGAVTLPHGTRKTVRVAVFAEGSAADEAKEAGADVVGGNPERWVLDFSSFHSIAVNGSR